MQVHSFPLGLFFYWPPVLSYFFPTLQLFKDNLPNCDNKEGMAGAGQNEGIDLPEIREILDK